LVRRLGSGRTAYVGNGYVEVVLYSLVKEYLKHVIMVNRKYPFYFGGLLVDNGAKVIEILQIVNKAISITAPFTLAPIILR
jgi:hypothetical protein